MIYIIKLFFCGVICSFLFPPFFLYPLGFIVFPYLFFILNDKKFQKINKFIQFVYGVFFGLGITIIVLYWVREPFLFSPSTESYSFFSFFLMLYVAIYFGIFFLILSFFKNNFSKLIMIPIILVITEIIRENFLFGFPWVTFALIGSSNYYFLQLAYFIGTNGLSFLLISLFLIPVVFCMLKDIQIKFLLKIYLIISFLLIFVLTSLMFIRLNFIPKQEVTINNNFSLNQLNIKQSDKYNSQFNEDRIKEILKIINSQKNTIYIFSETDYPFIIKNHNIVDFFQGYISNNNSIIIGGIRKDESQYYNSIYFITQDYFQLFDKIILVPFGEFLPFRKHLRFLENIVGSADLEKGKLNRLIKTNFNLNFIPVICYEIIFFNDLLSTINQNSPLLINITNDAWFGKHSGPYQHFYLSRIRSSEYNKFLIRVSNNGISATIDNYGKIINYFPLNRKKIQNFNINIPFELNNLTSFHKLIYLFIIVVTIFAVTIEKRIEKI